jgi:predicted porin
MAVTDPGMQNNVVGSLMYPAITEGVGSESNSTGAAYTIRTNNQLSLNSDNFSGFTLNAMWVMNGKNTTQTTTISGTSTNVTGGTNNQNGWGVGANFAWQKLLVTANWQDFNSKNAYNEQLAYSFNASNSAGTPTTVPVGSRAGFPTVGYAGGASTPGTNVKDNQFYAAATYDFGILKAYAQYIDRKVTAQNNDNFYVKRNATQIGVRSYITPTIEAWASGGLGRYTGFGGNAANLTAWQIGSNYYLSKRTNLYAIYGQSGTSNASLPTNYSGTSSNGNPSSTNASNYAVGVRHTF